MSLFKYELSQARMTGITERVTMYMPQGHSLTSYKEVRQDSNISDGQEQENKLALS